MALAKTVPQSGGAVHAVQQNRFAGHGLIASARLPDIMALESFCHNINWHRE
jgi:hypothetical protein